MKQESCCERNGSDMEEFVLQNDPARMNWVEGYIEWGTVRCAAPLRVETEQVREGDILRERYTYQRNKPGSLYQADRHCHLCDVQR